MSGRTSEQKDEVNNQHCLLCFKLRVAVLGSLAISLILIIIYGYHYLFELKQGPYPANYYIYMVMLTFESIISLIMFFVVYLHHRKGTKIVCHVLSIRAPLYILVFAASQLFNYLHFVAYIIWYIFQLVLLVLVWRYRQLLKRVYDWDDEEEPQSESEDSFKKQKHKKHKKRQNHKQRANDDAKGKHISVNLTVQAQQTQPPNTNQPKQKYQPPPPHGPSGRPIIVQPVQYVPYPVHPSNPFAKEFEQQAPKVEKEPGAVSPHMRPHLHPHMRQPFAHAPKLALSGSGSEVQNKKNQSIAAPASTEREAEGEGGQIGSSNTLG